MPEVFLTDNSIPAITQATPNHVIPIQLPGENQLKKIAFSNFMSSKVPGGQELSATLDGEGAILVPGLNIITSANQVQHCVKFPSPIPFTEIIVYNTSGTPIKFMTDSEDTQISTGSATFQSGDLILPNAYTSKPFKFTCIPFGSNYAWLWDMSAVQSVEGGRHDVVHTQGAATKLYLGKINSFSSYTVDVNDDELMGSIFKILPLYANPFFFMNSPVFLTGVDFNVQEPPSDAEDINIGVDFVGLHANTPLPTVHQSSIYSGLAGTTPWPVGYQYGVGPGMRATSLNFGKFVGPTHIPPKATKSGYIAFCPYIEIPSHVESGTINVSFDLRYLSLLH